jgi:tol-pal system protein YbgF
MKRRASFPLISFAIVMALAGGSVIGAPPAWAQQRGAQPAAAAPQGPLDERMIRLEQRILDLQTVIGTLQTFVRDGGGVPAQGGFPPAGGEGAVSGGVAPGGGPSELSIRVLALETQIKALTTQMEQITTRLDQINSGAGAQSLQGASPLQHDQRFGAPPSGVPLGQSQPQQRLGAPRFGMSTADPQRQSPFADPGPVPQAQAGVQAPQPFPPAAAPPAVAPSTMAPSTVVSPAMVPPVVAVPGVGAGARAIYDASYQSFLRNDFQGAGNGFKRFVKTFPDDPLISNAYYWLGRTHYAGRQYEPAAKAFLAGYKKGKKSPIAADSLLHLGMSLGAMGEKEAACSTLSAVSKQFPDAPPTLKQDVSVALKRTRC